MLAFLCTFVLESTTEIYNNKLLIRQSSDRFKCSKSIDYDIDAQAATVRSETTLALDNNSVCIAHMKA